MTPAPARRTDPPVVLDAFAVLAWFRDEPAADTVSALLDRHRCELTAPGVAEVLDHLVRLLGADPDTAALDLAALGLYEAPALTSAVSSRAGLLRARHHHRRHRAVSLADCVAAEHTRQAGAMLATSDPHLLDLCAAEGIATIVLLDSGGGAWAPATEPP